ncbi:hypothetical protein GGP84_002171 [Salinibacter ruber]|uniref:sulfotransferase family protein n=1 Tax=Salinibacter ruber TaxID=146919 RepID=UPI0021681E95|nr:sulfotransferase family protein [Salinibacter ruber]MCS3939539.1 hypothetical protein [Salinibacter ruber]
MVVSYKNKFIFMHCRKTGGSSITCFLNRYLGQRDIQIGVWGDTIKNGGNYNIRVILDILHPRCSLNISSWGRLVKELYRGKKDMNKIIGRIQKVRYGFFENPPHPTAIEVKRYFNNEWDNFYKFCFVRNPYEKAVSDYIYRVESRGKNVSFSQFLERIAKPEVVDPENVVPNRPVNWPMYTINDNIAVDFIGRYEKLEDHLSHICKNIDIKYDTKLLPVSKRKKDYNYREYYSDKEKELVDYIYEREINEFNYSF